jgi:hypothetical protein
MKYLKFLAILLIVSSCGGGGGGGSSTPAIPFAITLGLTSFSVNEDTSYSGSISATANEVVTLVYSATSQPSSGSLTLNASTGAITYLPQEDFNGTDQFQYSVTATEKTVTRNGTVNITVNPVDDAPTIGFEASQELSKDTMAFDDTKTFRVNVADKDTDLEDLTYDLLIGNEVLIATFTPDTGDNQNGAGALTVDLTQLQKAGLYSASIRVSDGNTRGTLPFETWFIADKKIVSINQDDDPDDGFDGGEKTSKDYYVYYLSGNTDAIGKTKYLFIADSISSEANSNGTMDIDLYRKALIASVNKLNDSDASEFFTSDYFTIVSAEPVDPDASSPVGIRTNCYEFDERVYCIGNGNDCVRDYCSIDTPIFNALLESPTLISILTRLDGRGVNSGNKNIQTVRDTNPENTRHTLMHELGHAHGYMGDEYRSDERDLTDRGYNVNTTTQSDVSLLKWNHHIADQLNVLGKDIQVCYNYANGTIGDWDDLGITIDQCDCLANEWDANGNFIRKNPECNKVGLFEGNYYGLYDNYRPSFCSVMDSCTSAGYGKVNVEGFAVGSIQNQGFNIYDSDISFTTNDTGAYTGITFTVNADYDTSKITLKWYADGVEDASKENQKTVTFDKLASGALIYYTARAFDLTGTILASDDVLDRTDFYEGAFESYLVGCSGFVSGDGCDYDYSPSPSTYLNYDFLYWNGPLGFTWGQNWTKW